MYAGGWLSIISSNHEAGRASMLPSADATMMHQTPPIPPLKTSRKKEDFPSSSLFCKYNDDNKGAYGAIPIQRVGKSRRPRRTLVKRSAPLFL
jgi:hypothetical protein